MPKETFEYRQSKQFYVDERLRNEVMNRYMDATKDDVLERLIFYHGRDQSLHEVVIGQIEEEVTKFLEDEFDERNSHD